jgi:hypothetical protein
MELVGIVKPESKRSPGIADQIRLRVRDLKLAVVIAKHPRAKHPRPRSAIAHEYRRADDLTITHHLVVIVVRITRPP